MNTSTTLTRLARTHIHFLGRSWPAFRFCGICGWGLGTLVPLVLGEALGLSLWVIIALLLCAVSTFVALTMVTKILSGEEKLIYYHHEIAVLAAEALLLHLIRQPVAPYLDLGAIGLGVFLACGRIGCMLVGCCHGRPCRWGVTYGSQHAAAGFPEPFVGVRLLPVQGFEVLWVVLVVAVACAAVLSGAPGGTGFRIYVAGYAFGRFFLEYLRGDGRRRYWLSFSEAQWTSLVLITLTAWPAGLALAIFVCVRIRRGETAAGKLTSAAHVAEIAHAVAEFRRPGAPGLIRLCTTSKGVRIAAGVCPGSARQVEHFSLSATARPLDAEGAAALAGVLARLSAAACWAELIPGHNSIFHVLIVPH